MIVNKEQLSTCFDVSVRTLTTWQNRQKDPLPIARKGKRGASNEYALADCIRWYVRQELAKLVIGSDGEAIDYEKERAELTRAQKEGQQIKNDIALGKVAPVAVAEFAVAKVGSECAGILDSIPLTVRRKHPDLNGQHIESIKRECVRAMNAMTRVGDAFEEAIREHISSLD